MFRKKSLSPKIKLLAIHFTITAAGLLHAQASLFSIMPVSKEDSQIEIFINTFIYLQRQLIHSICL